jgi:hypothetical protein
MNSTEKDEWGGRRKERRFSGKVEEGSHDNTMGEIVKGNFYSFEENQQTIFNFP